MAPDRTTSDNSARRRLPFKPPRQVSRPSTASVNTPSINPKGKSRSTSTSKPKASSTDVSNITISSDEASDEEGQEDVLDTTMQSMTSNGSRRRQSGATGGLEAEEALFDVDSPSIPRELLTRLIYDKIDDKDMRMGKEAMHMLQKYMDTFVQEAIARARAEDKGPAADEGWVNVDDLEKVAPQMVLDF